MIESASEARWYVVHTYSGYENKVKTNLEKIVENRGLSDVIIEARVPTETVIDASGSEQKEVENKIFPSYVLIKMVMSDETWHVVRNIRGVTGFVGPGSKPTPLSDAEVEALGVETVVMSLSFEVGNTIKIKEGPLAGFTGKVEEISPDKKKVTVLVSMFGRDTSVELDPKSVEKAEA